MKIFFFCFLAFCAGLVCGYWKQAYDHPAFCSEIEERLFEERSRHHGLKGGGHVWKDGAGVWRFRDIKGRTGRFI